MVATKAALSIRVDALTDSDGKSEPTAPSIGIENRAKLESRLRALEHTGDLHGAARFAGNGKSQQRFEMKGETKTYNTQADAVGLVSTQREDPIEAAVKAVLDVKEEKRKAKEERRAKRRAEKEKSGTQDSGSDVEMEDAKVMEAKEDKKEKKRKRRESGINGADEEPQAKVSYLFSTHVFLIIDHTRRRRRKMRRRREGRRARQRRRKQPPQQMVIHQRRRRKSQRHNPSCPCSYLLHTSLFYTHFARRESTMAKCHTLTVRFKTEDS
jgi:hypothetical protein